MADVRILTTHVGSLPGPPGFDPTAPQDEQALRSAVRWIVKQQRAAGLDIVNEGELTEAVTGCRSRTPGSEESM